MKIWVLFFLLATLAVNTVADDYKHRKFSDKDR